MHGLKTLGAALALGIMATAAGACPRALPPGAGQMVPQRGIDQALLDAAVLAEVNYHRCKSGRAALGRLAALRAAATGHSRWMAATGRLNHNSTRPGRRTPGQRLEAEGLRYKVYAENIGMVNRLKVDGRRVQVVDRARCRFAVKGRAVEPHSYASLARLAVTMWMNSRGHRRNLMRGRVRLTATAAAFEPGGRYCGRYWLTQEFMG